MNDLLAELNATVGDDGSASKKPDRPSSPLRPNPKYCSMEQPAGFRPAAANHRWTDKKGQKPTAFHTSPHLQKRGTPSHSAPHRGPGGTPTEFAARGTIFRAPPNAPPSMLQKLAELTGTPYSAPVIQPPIPSPSVSPTPSSPPIVQREASTGGGMETPSSPIKPNEKYCKIVAPSKRPLPPRPLAVQLARPVQQFRNQGLVWRPDDDRPHSTRRTSDPPPPDPPPPDRALPEPMDRSPSPVDYRTPPRLAAPLPVAGLYTREKAIADWDRQMEVEEIERRIRERVQREDLERRKEREREKARLLLLKPKSNCLSNETYLTHDQAIARQREKDEQERKRREEKERREFQARVEAEEDDRRRYEAKQEQQRRREEEERRQGRYAANVLKDVERKRREKEERLARAQLDSFGGAHSRPGAATVRMTKEQLEALKAECMVEGERKAMEEARKAAARRDESEPMEVEESDVVESSVPASCTGTAIAPKKLWIKAEPRSCADAVRRQQKAVYDVACKSAVIHSQIPLPPTSPPGSPRVKKEEGKKKDGTGKEDDEKDLEIIDKPPAEVITLSDGDEDTVATVPGDTVAGSTVAVKQEARPREVDDDVWIFASKRIPKKKHVFDPTKVKKEKEEKPKVSHAAQTPPILPFNTSRVKVEPAEKARMSGVKEKDTARKAVKAESSDGEWEERVDRQPRPLSAVPPTDCEKQDAAAADVLQAEVGAALARLKTLIPEPAPGSFMHALRTGCRKRHRCCDADEKEWQRDNDEFKRRILEDEEDGDAAVKHVPGGPSYPREAPPFFLAFPLHSLPGLNEE
ncbi:hypothetical protein PRIPAC_93852 [Pristionchus pacificus]|uniref:Uncharacterized protein n=1 Tax=Pristionchus pacificus TaxID=54126 RepID=A0A2A6CE26_PRIPA|nr:hypothetical protein PRIPAC_93852 [Pristionchus pacificus]|eukprot:PDM76303.1 hypothetical protein PRIPAC_39907 [Pristionchus pacificus]